VQGDPIAFQVTDLTTGQITTGTLFSSSTDLQGTGSWSWESGTFALNASYFDFDISIDSPFTLQQGTADLQVRNGLITASSGTGIFAGVFPSVGSAGSFSVPLASSFSLNYDLGTFNNDPVAVQFTLDNGGSACVTPEPSPLFSLLVLAGFPVYRRMRAAASNKSHGHDGVPALKRDRR
jgi:hypothetical protein